MLVSWLNLVTTVIGFGMSATFIVFVCARLICGRIRSTDSGAATTTTDHEVRSDIFDQPEHAVSGLEPVLVAAIPTIKYKRGDFSLTEDAQCPICLGEYEEKEMLRVLPQCHHSFHLSCIDLWLHKQSTCPICRLPLNESLEAKYAQILNDRASIDQYSRWLLPSHQRSDQININRENPGSISITIGGSRGQGNEDRI